MSKIDWSKAPEDATHAGLTRSDLICWYKDVSETGYSYRYLGDSCWGIGTQDGPTHQPLERRPEDPAVVFNSAWVDGEILDMGKSKDEWPEPQWVPGDRVDLRDVGEGLKGFWGKAEIRYISDSHIVWTWVEGAHQGSECSSRVGDVEIRATQSHRDKVIEAAEQHIPVRLAHKTKDLRVIFSDLYDCGMLKLPEGE